MELMLSIQTVVKNEKQKKPKQFLFIYISWRITELSVHVCVLNVSVTQQEVVLFLTLLKYFTACPRSVYNSTCLVNCFTGAYSFDKAKRKKLINTPSNIITFYLQFY